MQPGEIVWAIVFLRRLRWHVPQRPLRLLYWVRGSFTFSEVAGYSDHRIDVDIPKSMWTHGECSEASCQTCACIYRDSNNGAKFILNLLLHHGSPLLNTLATLAFAGFDHGTNLRGAAPGGAPDEAGIPRRRMSVPIARPSDVNSIAAILHASYEVISGPAGQPRDWDRFRSLFVPGARLMPVISVENPRVRVLTPEDYIRRVEPIFVTEPFWERESSCQIETVGRIAHVLSHYESLHDPDGTPFERGTNSVQLFHDGVRWWIVSIMWNTSRGE